MMSRVAAVAVIAAAMTTAVTGCVTAPRPVVLEGEGLGATWSVKIAGDAPRDLASVRLGIQTQVDSVGHHLSRWVPDSSLNVMNAAASDDWQVVPPELFASLSYAFALARDTDGAFDPTVAALVDVWGFGTAGRIYSPPSADTVRAARELVGFEKVSLDAAGHRVRKPAGLQIDLSSMQHGTGADAVGRYLESIGVIATSSMSAARFAHAANRRKVGRGDVAIERPPAELSDAPANKRHEARAPREAAGSQIRAQLRRAHGRCAGRARRKSPRRRHRHLRQLSLLLRLQRAALFPSHRPAHGEPVAHTLAAVTVIDPECAHADALATALTVLGPVEGLKFATERNIAALFIERTDNGLVEHMTPQFAAYAGRGPAELIRPMRFLLAAAIIVAYIVFTVVILRAHRRKAGTHSHGHGGGPPPLLVAYAEPDRLCRAAGEADRAHASSSQHSCKSARTR